MELLNIGADRHEDAFGLRDHVGVMAVGVFADVVQRRGDHLRRGVEEMHATVGQLFHIGRIKNQVPRVDRGVFAQSLFDLTEVYANAGGAPHVVDRMRIVGIILFGARGNHVPHILKVRQLGGVQRLECPGSDLALQEGARGDDHVIARPTGQHFSFQHFVAVEHIVDQFDAGLFFKFFQQGFVDIVGPVIDPDRFRRGRTCHQGGNGDAA